MFDHIVTTPPTLEPVTLDECRDLIGIGQPGQIARDEIIKAAITVARKWSEHYCERYIMRQTITAVAEKFCGWTIELKAPLVSVVSIKYIDISGVEVTLDPAKYLVSTKLNRVSPSYGNQWPCVREQDESVKIEYLVGVLTQAEVEESFKYAIKLTVNSWEKFQNLPDYNGYPPDFSNLVKNILGCHRDSYRWMF